MKENCIGHKPGLPYCTILTENVCEKCGGACSFFKTRERARADRESAEQSLARRGLKPKVVIRTDGSGNRIACQGVVSI